MTATSGQPSQRQASSRPDEITVNHALTPKRRRPATENSAYTAFARRILRAYSHRIATGDIESLIHLINLADNINNAIQQAVAAFGPQDIPEPSSANVAASPVKPHNNGGLRGQLSTHESSLPRPSISARAQSMLRLVTRKASQLSPTVTEDTICA